MDDTAALSQRRRRWLITCAGLVGCMALIVGWLWWDARGFNPGDTLQVTADVVACGRMEVAAGGEKWQSDQHAAASPLGEGDLVLGDLRRTSENEAAFVPEDGATVILERIRPGRFVTLGCTIPEEERAVFPQS